MTEELPDDFQVDHSDNTMFQDAVASLRKGDKPRAKELITQLLKNDQSNSTYWIWLSASVDNSKERIYCLQTALKLDPENQTAKRGLILLGALAADETVQPFVVNRPRAWEEKLLLANEKPREKGFKALMKSPVMRLAGMGVMLAGLVAVALFGFIIPRRSNFVAQATNTPGPSPTFTTTPTVFGAVASATPFSIGPTPLWMLLAETYTPTPVYVNTPRAGQSRDQYRVAEAAYQKGDWDTYIASMKQIIPLEPNSADVYYLIGEAYRFNGDSEQALKAYNDALKVNENFGPAHLGLARARLMNDPAADVETSFERAIKLDPNFGEIYIEFARYYLLRKNTKAALAQLEKASELLPESSEVYIVYARTYLAMDEREKALEAAEKAYALDITALPVYQLLGEMYIESGQYQRAIEALDVFVVYEENDAQSFAFLGRAYFEMKNYEKSVENFDKAFDLSRNTLRRYFVYRGMANLEVGDPDAAVEDLESALQYEPQSFDANLGLARAYFMQEKFGSAFQRVEPARSLAETDEQKALAFYWRALIQEKRELSREAVKDWQALLAMDEDVMTAEMRKTAEQRLKSLVTPTFTPTPTRTPRGGVKTPTPTATKKVGTPTPTPTLKVTVTATPK